jgi:CRP/FNR family cyclic AMP-dependent transcriptional regulator
MSPPIRRTNAYQSPLNDLFRGEHSIAVRQSIEPSAAIYTTGDSDDALYYVESGQVKVFMSSANGKDCLIDIYAAGDLFGESCLAQPGRRIESARAMSRAVVHRLPRREFLSEVSRSGAMEALVQHLAVRMCERQTAVFDLVTMSSERRLIKVLLQLGHRLGTADGPYLRIAPRISQEELAQIVGTTRPRITAFMQRLRAGGIIDTRAARELLIHRAKAREYLAAPDRAPGVSF